jgi:hypothetical protein
MIKKVSNWGVTKEEIEAFIGRKLSLKEVETFENSERQFVHPKLPTIDEEFILNFRADLFSDLIIQKAEEKGEVFKENILKELTKKLISASYKEGFRQGKGEKEVKL